MNIIVKTKEQINGIRKSSKLAAECLLYIKDFVKPGIKTIDLDKLLNEFIVKHNAIPAPLNYLGFPNSACISVNEVVCHGVPNEYVLKNGDIVNIDVTTILNGYYGDTSETFPVGKISKEAKKLMEITKSALNIGIQQVRPNNYYNNIGYEIGKYVLPQGYGIVTQFMAHGDGFFFF